MRPLVVVLLCHALAHAELCPLPDGAAPALAAVDADTRLHFLQRGMRRAAHQARVWAWSSAGVLAAVSSFQVVVAIGAPKQSDRIDMAIGAAATTFSLAQMAAVVPLVTIDQWTLDRHVRRARPDGDRCALVAEGERFLKRDARSEQLGTGPGMHAATILFNIGMGALLGIGFNHWDSAAINVLLGAALGELQILTQPTDSVKLLDRYRAGDMTPRKGEKAALDWRLLPAARRDGGGLMLVVPF